MYPQSSDSAVSAALPVVVVIAVSTIAVTAIAAWLAHDIFRRAIERTNPGEVSAVVRALAAVLTTLVAFLPWSAQQSVVGPQTLDGPTLGADGARDPELPGGEDHEAQRQIR